MSEKTKQDSLDIPTDAQKFDNAIRVIMSTPKEVVEARIAADKERRNRREQRQTTVKKK